MTSGKHQSQSLSLLFCKMGYTPHHEALGPQSLTSLCVGADPKIFSDTLVSDVLEVGGH